MAKYVKKPWLPPMPIDFIADSPGFIGMGATARGMFFNVIYHYWLSDCRALPKSSLQWLQITGATLPSFKAHGHEVRALVEIIAPRLKAWRTHVEARRNNLALARDAMNDARRRRALEKGLGERQKFAPGADVSPIVAQSVMRQKMAPERGAAKGTGFVDR